MKLLLLSEGDNGYRFYSMCIDKNNTIYFYVFNGRTYLLDTKQKVLISIADNLVIKPIESHDLPLKPETTHYGFEVDSTGVGICIHKDTNMAMVDKVYNIIE